MMEKLEKALTSRASAAFLTDLSKVFDCLPHDLLIAKLYAHGVKKESLNLISNLILNII